MIVILYFVTPRRVRKSEGLKLARAYSTLFGEVSALDGRNVDHAIIELAKLLAERQDFNIQKTIKLSEKQEKKSCCWSMVYLDFISKDIIVTIMIFFFSYVTKINQSIRKALRWKP